MLSFASNTQIIDDPNLSISQVVFQVQNLAKKHVESLHLMHEFANNTLSHITSLSSAKSYLIDQKNKVIQDHESDTTFLLN